MTVVFGSIANGAGDETGLSASHAFDERKNKTKVSLVFPF
jgi:hypothetical protein